MSFLKATQGLLKTVNAVFGTSATYTQLDGGVVTTIKGVFDHRFIEKFEYNTREAVFRIALSDLPAEPARGDTILIGSTLYTVVSHEPDPHGATTIQLGE